MFILSESLRTWIVMTEFSSLPAQTQMLCILVGLFFLKPLVKGLIDLWDYICLGRDKRQELRERGGLFSFNRRDRDKN